MESIERKQSSGHDDWIERNDRETLEKIMRSLREIEVETDCIIEGTRRDVIEDGLAVFLAYLNKL